MIVCADDFGLREDIDEAILELCAARKLSAVSCMVLFEGCSAPSLQRLSRFQEHIDIGLHLCLTQEPAALSPRQSGAPLLFQSYADCLRATWRRKAARPELEAEIVSQYEMFEARCGRGPDYIDGHLHIHQAPGVRDALIAFTNSLPPKSRPYVRNTYLPIARLAQGRLPWAKALIIGSFGKRMAAALKAKRISTNDGFAGIYDFPRWKSFPGYLPRFVNCLTQPNGLLVVHPGKTEDWRRREFETLRTFTFRQAPHRFLGCE
jgi:hypothetical protein